MLEIISLRIRCEGVSNCCKQYGLFEHLFPQSAAAFALPPYAYAQEMLELGLANTDERIAADKPVTPTFLFAVLLWGAVLREMNERQAGPAPDLRS